MAGIVNFAELSFTFYVRIVQSDTSLSAFNSAIFIEREDKTVFSRAIRDLRCARFRWPSLDITSQEGIKIVCIE